MPTQRTQSPRVPAYRQRSGYTQAIVTLTDAETGRRRDYWLPGANEFTFIGVSGKKMFVDATLPPGQDSVQYTVQGQRADSSGPLSPIFAVNFGRSAAGTLTASVATAGTLDGAGGTSLVDAIINSRPLANGHTPRERARV